MKRNIPIGIETGWLCYQTAPNILEAYTLVFEWLEKELNLKGLDYTFLSKKGIRLCYSVGKEQKNNRSLIKWIWSMIKLLGDMNIDKAGRVYVFRDKKIHDWVVWFYSSEHFVAVGFPKSKYYVTKNDIINYILREVL
jgi:hypothetical protein